MKIIILFLVSLLKFEIACCQYPEPPKDFYSHNWSSYKLGKNLICDKKFKDILEERNNIRYDSVSDFVFDIGYLRNIDFYYISYKVNNENTYTEFYKLFNSTDIDTFFYTKLCITINEKNKNHFVLDDCGYVNFFNEYIIIYNKQSVNLYKRIIDPLQKYKLVSGFYGFELIYDKSKHEFIKKSKGIKGYENGYFETYVVVNDKFTKIK